MYTYDIGSVVGVYTPSWSMYTPSWSVHSVRVRVGFLDSLHNPSAYVTSHDIPDVAIPVNKPLLTPPPETFRVL